MEEKASNEAPMYPWDRAWLRRKARAMRLLTPAAGEGNDQ